MVTAFTSRTDRSDFQNLKARSPHQADAVALRVQAEAEARAYEERVKAAEVLEGHPALLGLAELETLRELAKNANVRLYLGGDPRVEA